MSRLLNRTAARDAALETELLRSLNGAAFGRPVYGFQRVASTMDVAHRLAADGATEGTLVWAVRQEQGRGRLGRAWESPEGGAYLSLILRPGRPPQETPQLPLVAGLAVAEAIHESTRLHPTIRWPNDLLLDGKKVCGILVEAKNGAVIVGVGINVTTAADHLPETATSLLNATVDIQHSTLRMRVTGALCRHFQTGYDAWTRQGFAPIRDALRPWMELFGQPVQMALGSRRIEGIAGDLDESGRLLVRLDSGLVRAFDMGEVTRLR